jgi:hypothetical protein
MARGCICFVTQDSGLTKPLFFYYSNVSIFAESRSVEISSSRV